MKQFKGGPGRGMFQYEGPSGATAVKRTLSFFKEKGIDPPQWLSQLKNKKSVDFSQLSEEQQRMLFLGDKKMGAGDLSKVMSGKQTIQEFWGKYHQTQNDPVKIKKFTEDMKRYNKDKIKNIDEVELPKIALNKKGGILCKY